MKVLITGIGGFIGRELAKLFLEEGAEVIGLYRRSRPELPGLTLVQGDLAEGLDGVPAADLVIHAAAQTHLMQGSVAADYIRNNLQGGLQLNDYLRRTAPGRVIYLSTLSVYGAVETTELIETTPLNQPGLYGLSKYMGEQLLAEVREVVPVTCLRLPGVVGRDYFEPWLGKVLARALKHEPITIYNGDGLFNNIVDPLELFRFIRHLDGIATPRFDQLNLAATEPLVVRAMIEGLLREVGSRSTVEERTSTQNPFTISIEKLARDYGFPSRSTRAMVEAYARCNRRID